jgi:hypothetical protein
MLRAFPVLATGAAVLGLTAFGQSGPAAFAAPASHPKVHTFTLPAVTGVKAWGSYSFAGGKAHITLCAKETASDVDMAIVVGTALNAAATKHQAIEIEIFGSGKQECKSLATSDSAHLYAVATSGTTDGKAHEGKIVKIY